jgi:hypothetical protein
VKWRTDSRFASAASTDIPPSDAGSGSCMTLSVLLRSDFIFLLFRIIYGKRFTRKKQFFRVKRIALTS